MTKRTPRRPSLPSDGALEDDSLLTSDVEGIADEHWGSSCSSLHYEVPGGANSNDPHYEQQRRKRRLRRKHTRRTERKERALRVVKEQAASFAPTDMMPSPSGAAGGSVVSAAAVHLNEEVNDYWSSSDASNDRHSTKFTKNLEKRYKRQMEYSDKLRTRSQAIIDSMLSPQQRAGPPGPHGVWRYFPTSWKLRRHLPCPRRLWTHPNDLPQQHQQEAG